MILSKKKCLVLCLACIHTALLVKNCATFSPTYDEYGHLPSGVSHWLRRDFTLYRVNPPLARMIAALPYVVMEADNTWMANINWGGVERQEFQAGTSLVEVYGEKSFALFFWARVACIPFSVGTLILCSFVARHLYGPRAGLFAATFWCFSPTSLGYGSVILPDMAAAMAGVGASFAFFLYFKTGSYSYLIYSGLALGLALLFKSTWIILIGLWPLVILARAAYAGADFREIGRQAFRLAFIGGIAFTLVNAGYMFQKTGQPLGEILFVSETLTQRNVQSTVQTAPSINCFSGTGLGNFRVPLPIDYLMGIDQQRRDFEYKTPSYLRNEWKYGGWWYYYIYAFLVKEPIGVLLLTGFASVRLLCCRQGFSWRCNFVFFLPAVALIVLVSSQTGFNRHYRYVLPALPFGYIFLSGIANLIWNSRPGRYFVLSSLSMVILTGVSSSPYHFSYFNEFAGGFRGGPRHLLNSNLDWGQDLLPLKRWLSTQKLSEPVYLAYTLPKKFIEPLNLGVQYRDIPKIRKVSKGNVFFDFTRLKPGTYVIFVSRLFDIDSEFEVFRELEPDLIVGTTAYVYRINEEQLDRWSLSFFEEIAN